MRLALARLGSLSCLTLGVRCRLALRFLAGLLFGESTPERFFFLARAFARLGLLARLGLGFQARTFLSLGLLACGPLGIFAGFQLGFLP
ncbi:MAG: hypothetical protein JNM79_06775 [Burkholderiales bacterium]|nr:hypothetical protein [Burkholderiales bacterium]